VGCAQEEVRQKGLARLGVEKKRLDIALVWGVGGGGTTAPGRHSVERRGSIGAEGKSVEAIGARGCQPKVLVSLLRGKTGNLKWPHVIGVAMLNKCDGENNGGGWPFE